MAETTKAKEDAAKRTAPADVKTVAHEQDRAVIESRDVFPEGVLIVDDETYGKVARLGGFFNPATEASSYRPPLPVSKLKGEEKENVLKVLSEGGKG